MKPTITIPDFDTYIREFINNNNIISYLFTPCYDKHWITYYTNSVRKWS